MIMQENGLQFVSNVVHVGLYVFWREEADNDYVLLAEKLTC